MFCQKCGTNNDEHANHCSNCGAALSAASEATVPGPIAPAPALVQDIPNYLVQSILATLFCCIPFGIVAIVFAAQVNSKVQGGDIAGALSASKKAKQFVWISFWLGLISMIISLVSFSATLVQLIPLINSGNY